jgi:hypothetical protein
MGIELYLKAVSPEQLQQMQEQGAGSILNDLYEGVAANRDGWLLLDEHIFGFMRHENPQHPVLYEAVVGGTPFPDSMDRDDFPRAFLPADVKRMANALSEVTDAELQTRFAATRNIFGGIAIGGTDEESYERLVGLLRRVTDHYQAAADAGNGMLLLLY